MAPSARRRVRTPSAALMLGTLGMTALALSGCAAPGGSAPSPTGGDTQTVTQACETVRASVQDAAQQLQKLDANDPKAAVDALAGVAARLDDAARTVGNRQVSALLPPLQSGFASASADLAAIAGGDLSRLAALQTGTGAIQSALTTFTELCPPA